MINIYRVYNENGGYTEYSDIESIPKGMGYETINIPNLTPEEIEEKDIKEAIYLESERYIQRAKDGMSAYAEISAEFRVAKLNGIITEESHASIERSLITVRNEVLAGQWISAKNELISLGSSLIGLELYNRLLNQITQYISDNY